MVNLMVLLIFPLLKWQYASWASLVQTIKIACFSWNLVSSLFKYAEFDGNVHFFYFKPDVPFLGIFVLRNQNCLLKLNCGTRLNLIRRLRS